MTYDVLMQRAIDVSKNAYAPYSKFSVGASVLADSGEIYSGCNFENASFGMTICAERNAVGSAVANGEKKIKAVAIYSPNQDKCLPCGACRQVLHEFCDNDSELDVIVKCGDELQVFSLATLLPESFSL
ncbi:cytidine deaminase [bacterium]|nr:cytidine deaminase [bacterium]